MIGFSRDTFYRIKKAYEEGGIEPLRKEPPETEFQEPGFRRGRAGGGGTGFGGSFPGPEKGKR